MREIKFRGKMYSSGEWINGSLIDWGNGIKLIMPISTIASSLDIGSYVLCKSKSVVEGTVGQYTGLTDKNGKEIYEWDILKIISTVRNKNYDWYDINSNSSLEREDYAIVEWDEKNTGYRLKVYHDGKYKRIARFCVGHLIAYQAQVVGNIWDNSELIKGETNEKR